MCDIGFETGQRVEDGKAVRNLLLEPGKGGISYALARYYLPSVAWQIEWNPTNLYCLAKFLERMLKMPVGFSKSCIMY